MLKKTILIIFLSVAGIVMKAQETKPELGTIHSFLFPGQFTIDGEYAMAYEVEELLEDNMKALQLMKRYKVNSALEFSSIMVGGALIWYPIIVSISGNEPNYRFLLYGTGVSLVGQLIFGTAKSKRMDEIITIYNNEIKNSNVQTAKLTMGIQGLSFGLKLKF